MQSFTVFVMSLLISLSLVNKSAHAQSLTSKQRQLYCNNLLAGYYRYSTRGIEESTRWLVSLSFKQSVKRKASLEFKGPKSRKNSIGLVLRGSIPDIYGAKSILPSRRQVPGKAVIRFGKSGSLTVPVSFTLFGSRNVEFRSVNPRKSYDYTYYVSASRLEALLATNAIDVSVEYNGRKIYSFSQRVENAPDLIKTARSRLDRCSVRPADYEEAQRLAKAKRQKFREQRRKWAERKKSGKSTKPANTGLLRSWKEAKPIKRPKQDHYKVYLRKRCEKADKIYAAIRFMDLDGKWQTKAWYNLNRSKSKAFVARTRTPVFFVSAEGRVGSKKRYVWESKAHSFKAGKNNKTHRFVMFSKPPKNFGDWVIGLKC